MTGCLGFLRPQQMHPEDYHLARTRHKLTVSDWGVVQHRAALYTVTLEECADKLVLPNLDSM